LASDERSAFLKATLEKVQGQLIQRIPAVAVRSPDDLAGELSMLDTV